jgi:hypothetical protein
VKLQKREPLGLIAPRAASRLLFVLAAATEYRPCSAGSRDEVAAVARTQKLQATVVAHR